MPLARLDNEVFFKKAFTDEFVLKAFVRDIVGIDIRPDRIETEKSFAPKVGNIDFRYDIFAEDSTNRIIVEIQKVQYDHNFDRFLHYYLQAIAEQQRNFDNYRPARTVYTIVVMTAKYHRQPRNGELYEDEVLISKMNPFNLKGIERKIFNHEMIILNPNYKGEDTPANYRDWLDLIYESIHHPDAPGINLNNQGVKRASELVEVSNIDPTEWEQAKLEASKLTVLDIKKEEGREEGREEGIEIGKELGKEIGKEETNVNNAINGIKAGFDNATISTFTGLTDAQINQLREKVNNGTSNENEK